MGTITIFITTNNATKFYMYNLYSWKKVLGPNDKITHAFKTDEIELLNLL
jgi:hypothetical protein